MSGKQRKSTDRVNPSVLYSCLETDLMEYWKTSNGRPPPESSPLQVAAYQMLSSFYKKFVDVTHPDADARALEKFLQINDHCRNWELPSLSSWDEELVNELKIALDRFFYPEGMPLLTSFEQILHEGRVGPGASLGARGYDFYTKLFSSPLTTTSAYLYNAYKSYIWNFPEWSSAEIIRKETFGDAQCVQGNRLTFVPKTRDISRSICIEPSLNMFYQLGVKQILERRLVESLGINLAVQQSKNRELARLGSLDEVDGFVTIDLSSASDSMSIRMLRHVLPANQLAWLEALRSPKMTLPNGEQLELSMISTMGNGFTFPLQTILFSCVVVAAARVYNRPLQFPYGNTLGDYGVNGDDIICRKSILRGVLRLLDILGFKVNSDKTFIEGPFRESCGCDWYRGHFVRGIYVKTLDSTSSRYALLNALSDWSAEVGIPLPLTYQYLLSTVRFLPVPLWENADAGIRVPLSYVRQTLKRRNHGTILYRKVTPRRLSLLISKDRIRAPSRQRVRIYNPPGLLISYLQGCIQGGTIGIRLDTNQYRHEDALAPNWEVPAPNNLVWDPASLEWRAESTGIAPVERGLVWETMYHLNLGRETA